MRSLTRTAARLVLAAGALAGGRLAPAAEPTPAPGPHEITARIDARIEDGLRRAASPRPGRPLTPSSSAACGSTCTASSPRPTGWPPSWRTRPRTSAAG